jgi:hypothetical protein
LEKDEKGKSERLHRAGILIFLGALFLFLSIKGKTDSEIESEKDLQIDTELAVKYEEINNLIDNNEFIKARAELKKLVHPSDGLSSHEDPNQIIDNYKYNDYWTAKREELRQKIKEKGSSINTPKKIAIKAKTISEETTDTTKYNINTDNVPENDSLLSE